MKAIQTHSVLYVSPLLLLMISIFPLRLGIENVSDQFLRSLSPDKKLTYRVGLISNQTGCTQDGVRTVDLLRSKGVNIVCLMAPEHGFTGKVEAGKHFTDEVDNKTKIPIRTIYGEVGEHIIAGKHMNTEIVKDLDVIFLDLQDCGMRHYTYISTLRFALEVASRYNKQIVVFDRPNLLGPHMEGPLVEDALHSFISIASIPVRHGMTVGELAWYFNTQVLKNPARLHVVKMKNYSRNSKVTELAAALSPNVATLQSCFGYSFLGMLGDIQPFDVGVGTAFSFQCIMLPESYLSPSCDWGKLRGILATHGVQTVPYSYFSDRKKQMLTGLRLQITDINHLKSFSLFLEVVDFFKKAGIRFTYSPTFDKAVGTSLMRKMCEGACSRDTFTRIINNGLDAFVKKAKNSFMYAPDPLEIKL